MPANLAFILDFDGTLTENDVGAQLLHSFGGPKSPGVDDAFASGEISIREHSRLEAARMARDVFNQTRKAAPAFGTLRPGVREFIDFCEQQAIPVEIASNGWSFYVDDILVENGLGDVPHFAQVLSFDSNGNGILNPAHETRSCVMTGLCKCDMVWGMRRRGKRITYVGDGMSDFCVAQQADYLFARASLAAYCESENLAFTRFDDFFDVLDGAERLLRAGGPRTPKRSDESNLGGSAR